MIDQNKLTPVLKKSITTLVCSICLLLACTQVSAKQSNASNGQITNAIVKVYSVISTPSYYRPWQQRVNSGSGSGFVIDGNKILTNAHVVANQTFIEVRKYGDPKRYPAMVSSVSHEADLALLTVKDESFFEKIQPLEFNGLPSVQQEVLVYGFPTGGDTLSITKGIVSRIEHVRYVHSSLYFLAGQIDAAINPGNSGGPAISNGKVTGVAMQGRHDAENIGYLIPVPIIKHFLKDIEDGRYDGFPDLGLLTQPLENPDMKKKYGMTDQQTGVIVRYTLPGSPATGIIKEEDILLAVNGHSIADDGTVEFRPRERTNYGHFVDLLQVGEEIHLTTLRQGKTEEVDFKVDLRGEELSPSQFEQYDTSPRYFIFGGIVFSPLTKNLLREWGDGWQSRAPSELLVELNKLPTENERETVLALHVLASEINKGYHEISRRIIRKVNGQTYRDFEDFYQKLISSQSPYVVLTDDRQNEIVLDRQKALASHDHILKTYGIPKDRSPDLLQE